MPAQLAYIYKLSCFGEISLDTTPAFANILLNPYVQVRALAVLLEPEPVSALVRILHVDEDEDEGKRRAYSIRYDKQNAFVYAVVLHSFDCGSAER